ncbi:MAG: DegT/DnrJ/EryC1/StrS family aminotransferase [Deltaproteobacteria bacterium]|nr:DegT/DnrJ/EryC1/StrS family aminotransferase [Deltaproteobacteria bacterium]
MIPMVDLKRQYQLLKGEIDAALEEVFQGTQFILGPNVSALEAEIAAYHDISQAIGVASGTDALQIALEASGIGEGDEVITTPFTFVATAEVVSRLRARPVFVDIRPDTFNIDPERIEEKISAATKAIIPVHLFGHPADMDPICDLARRYGLKVIEDCAQAFGALYRGRKIGTLGHCGCFSFFPSKNLAGCGDGGMIITGEETTAGRIRLLRNHGSAVRYRHEVLGYNSRLDEIQAAIIRVKLKRIDALNDARRSHAELYRSVIGRSDILLPLEQAGCRHVYHQFTIRSRDRERIMAVLREEGIASAVYYPVPLHLQDVFSDCRLRRESLAQAETCAAEVLSLPMFPELTDEEIRRIGDVIDHAI